MEVETSLLGRLLAVNAYLMTRAQAASLTQDLNSVYSKCGYPVDITAEHLRLMYEREALAKRINNIEADYTWSQDPIIKCDDEKFLDALRNIGRMLQGQSWYEDKEDNEGNPLWYYLHLLDCLSGIGDYGAMLVGVQDDAESLSDPVEGIDLITGEMIRWKERKLVYLRCFPESSAQIAESETNKDSPRYELPKRYNLMVTDGNATKSITAHWTRVIHVCDGSKGSRVRGTPRIEGLYYRLLDVLRILGGSAQMFDKGGYPGTVFTLPVDLGDVEINTEAMKQQLAAFDSGYQRYLLARGIEPHQLMTQVASPKEHIDCQYQYIAAAKSCPLRIFLGSEQAVLAASEDKKRWHTFIQGRRYKNTNNRLLIPTLDRFIMLGLLPVPKSTFGIDWPELEVMSDKDRAEISKLITEAISKFTSSGIDAYMTFEDFLKEVLYWPDELVKTVIKAAQNVQDNDDNELETEKILSEYKKLMEAQTSDPVEEAA